MTKRKLLTTSPEQTEAIAAQIGHQLRGGEVIELVSDLGGGKTTFVRGLARGAGSLDHVSSPTFTISKQYQAKKLTIHHFDFYRLPEAGLIERELAELIGRPNVVIVVEWAEVIRAALPHDYLQISIDSLPGLQQENSRSLNFACADKLNYLIEALESWPK